MKYVFFSVMFSVLLEQTLGTDRCYFLIGHVHDAEAQKLAFEEYVDNGQGINFFYDPRQLSLWFVVCGNN